MKNNTDYDYPYNTEFSGDMTEEEMNQIDEENMNLNLVDKVVGIAGETTMIVAIIAFLSGTAFGIVFLAFIRYMGQ